MHHAKKFLTLLLSAALFAPMLGCAREPVPELDQKINEIGNEVSCIDEMPDWAGKKLDLVTWYCHGTNAPDRNKTAKQDLFREELYRVSGITVNPELSFDNNGESGDVKISKLIAKDEFPDIAFDLELNLQARLIKADKIYDLTELIPKYAVNLMKLVNSSDMTRTAFEDLKVDKKLYYFPKAEPAVFRYADPGFTEEKYAPVMKGQESREWIWVRDDILKTLHPNCRTQAEIERKYIDDGYFEKEDLEDFKITGYASFRNFLEEINGLNLVENGEKVWPFYTHNGTDNWDLLSVMNCLNGAYGISYFNYYDMEEKKILPTMKQPWFKEVLRFYNGLVRDGLASREALTDDKSEFDAKKDRGQYAIIYGNVEPPSDEVLRAQGKSFSYRKVLIDVPENHEKFIRMNQISNMFNGLRITIFKNRNIQEEDLEQVIRFIDFFSSEAGMKYSFYGPKKSGLYQENADGVLTYTDPKMERDMVDTGSKEALAEYGYTSWPSLANFAPQINYYDPRLIYAKLEPRRASQYTLAWNSALIEKPKEYPNMRISWDIWSWTQYVEGVQRFWDMRQASETAMQLIFTANTDEEFEALYNDMVHIVESNGLTEETMEEWNIKFNEMNKDYIYNLRNWKPD